MASEKVLSSPDVVVGMNRVGLYKHFAELGFKRGAEIGVWVGRNARDLLTSIPGVFLYLIDPFMAYKSGRSIFSADLMDHVRRRAKRRLRNANVEFLETTSLEASQRVQDESLDFVYVDGHHSYDNVMLDILLWIPKIKQGGVMSGHDYVNARRGAVGVKDAVDHYTYRHGIKFSITDIMVERNGERSRASWFWIKQ